MPWEDRDYYRSRESAGEYLGNPALFFGFSVPFGRWFGVPARLSFWLLLAVLFAYMDIFYGAGFLDVTLTVALLIVALLAHDFGHYFLTQRVGGSLNEFLLWPAGGLIHPSAPPRPAATFTAHGGGPLVNLGLGLACVAALVARRQFTFSFALLNPVAALFGQLPILRGSSQSAILMLWTFLIINSQIFLVNLLPFYWFDGGYLWEAILWRPLGHFRAVNATCIFGMVVAMPLVLFCFATKSFLGMAVCALLFASSYAKRRELKAAGAVSEDSFAYADAAYESDRPTWARRRAARQSRSAVKAATALRREQEKIDAILAKVHASGMQSLTWSERRTLSKATQRQRRNSRG